MTTGFGFDDLAQFLEPPDKVQAPIISSGDFAPTGYVGPWLAQFAYSLGDENDYSKEEIGYDFRVKPPSEWGGYFYYWLDSKKANEAKTAMGKEFPPQTVWTWRADTASILFSNEEARAKYGSLLSYSVRATGWWKHRHEWQLISLASAVVAIAKFAGLDVAPFDVDLISDLPNVLDLAESVALIGDKNGYEESKLGIQQREIWRSLGEENPKVNRVVGALTEKGLPSPLATTSEKLNDCLGIIYRWKYPIWCKVMTLPDPRVDAVSKAGNRNKLPCLTQMYPNQAAAVADFGEVGNSPATAEPPVPAIWKDWPQEWHKLVQRVGSASMPLPVAYEKEGGEGTVGCTLPELKTWVDYLKV